VKTYEDFASKHLNVVLKSGNEYMVRCVFHENNGSPSMQFNVEKGLYICFSCGARGGMKTLTKFLGIRYVEDPNLAVNQLIGKLNQLKSQKDGSDLQLTVLPEDALERWQFPTPYWGSCFEDDRPPAGCKRKPGCKHHRWLNYETQQAFDLGYNPLENEAIIPVRNSKGGLLGVIRRSLEKDPDVRYRYPKGLKKSHIFFGDWFVEYDTSDTAVIVEGSIDAMCVWQTKHMGLGQLGSSISREQIRLLLRMGIREVILGYDNDEAGRKAFKKALGFSSHLRGGKMVTDYDEAYDLRKHFFVRRFEWEPSDHDPGSCSTDDLHTLIENSRKVM
jgi:DNA primase